ncbi:GerMN domain-containing protein [uncultured Brachyspira sp.]|uniref:GerMN domain-containing protein n=1 Tax=uncultured Brachyspira sp. TaxID=221953 RepID=UPI0025F2E7A5|nr:GerMN domain-containing protein [uncultured Brachyspira sp.]
MPRYEQLKVKSKCRSYTRQIKNESKEINLKKTLIISAAFIITAALIFTAVKKYSPMVDIAVKDFFSFNHREALVLESGGMTEDQNKMSFLNNIPLFNFFIKTDTNKTLSVMTYETNSKIEASLENNNFTNSSIITRESLLPFFNSSGKNNSIIYDSDYIDYEDKHHSILFSNESNPLNSNINRIYEDNISNTETKENINKAEENREYNYLERIISENRKNNNTDNISKESSNQTAKSIFNDILKPKENPKKEITTMKPAASSVSFNGGYVNNTKENNTDTNKKYNFDIDEYLKNNNVKENNNKINNSKNTEAENYINNTAKDIMQSSVYTITNYSYDVNADYNRVINDMVNPNNIKKDNNININKEENKIPREQSYIKENIIQNNEYKKEIIKKAQNDIKNYNIKKANNNITRELKERNLKENINEGIYLVEYSESTGSITLIFRERKFNNKSSIEEAIKKLLEGATDYENNRNIISCIPKDTKLLDIFIENNTVYLNFNDNFEFNPLGNDGTMVQIYQFVYTATQFEGIDNVIFLINGRLNETIGAEGAIENMPFRRFQ